jgi:hypothetical protein
MATPKVLRRYTDLPAVVHLLRSKQVTLLSPSTWDDRNDRYYMDEFKKRRSLKTLLALCFTEASETYHHWRVFASGCSGVSIEFKKDALLESLPTRGFSHSPIKYNTIAKLAEANLLVKDLPFTKRHAFRDEREYRIVYTNKDEEMQSYCFPIDIKLLIISALRLGVLTITLCYVFH